MHLQRNATQRNATQRNAYQNYILNNNFKFYILQFFRAFNFLSAVFGFAKISSLIKNSFVKNNLSLRGDSRSNLFSVDCFASFHSLAMTIKNKFANLNNNVALAHCVNNSEKSTQGVETPCYKKWIASLIRQSQRDAGRRRALAPFVRNDDLVCHYEGVARSNLFSVDCHDFLRSLAMTIKNKFEIISQSDYGFCYKNYFFNLNQVFRNSYDFGERFGRNLNYGFEKNYNFGFGKNYFGNCNFGFDFGNEIYSIWCDLKGFLFNRKTKKNKFMSAF